MTTEREGFVRRACRAAGAAVRRIRPPDFRDLHVYGGLLMVGIGIGIGIGPAAGLTVPGAVLVYLGVWRLR